MTVFYVRAKLHFSPTRLPIEPGATLKRAHTLSPKTHMRLDHFGHNYELRDRALPDAEDVCPQLVLVSGLARGRLGWPETFPTSDRLAASQLRLPPVRGRHAGPAPERASKRTRLGIPQRRSDVRQRKLRVIQQLASGHEANLI
jgi:hypothetical protein